MVLGGIDRFRGHGLEDVALARELGDTGLDVVGAPEVLLRLVRLASRRLCSHHLVKMMYHEYADMITSRIITPFATKSP